MSINNNNLENIVDGIGSFIEYWGFRKIHGRIWGLLYLSTRPLSTPEVVQKLGVSKALASGAINELLDHNLIERVGQVKFGGITYEVTKSPAQVVREIIQQRELVLLDQIESHLSELDKMSLQEKEQLEINPESLKTLKFLTGIHKKIMHKICKKKIISMDDWIQFMKKISRFSF